MRYLTFKAGAGALLGALFVLAGCSETDPNPVGPFGSSLNHGGALDDPIVGHLEVCKVGTPADFSLGGDSDVGPNLSLAAGECQIVATVPLTGPPFESKTVSVTETGPANVALVSVTTRTCVGLNCANGVANNGDSFTIDNDTGITVTFTNIFRGGGEGCTPGYWKQEHHFDSWVGAAPTDLLSSVFMLPSGFRNPEGSVDPTTLTLAEALALRGGGINALTRHAVAAFLNASHPGVSYDLTPAEVVALYNGAKDGPASAIRDAKDTLEDFNEQGCPLN